MQSDHVVKHIFCICELSLEYDLPNINKASLIYNGFQHNKKNSEPKLLLNGSAEKLNNSAAMLIISTTQTPS